MPVRLYFQFCHGLGVIATDNDLVSSGKMIRESATSRGGGRNG